MSRAARPHGHDAAAQQLLPDGGRVVGREQQLDAVLARVAGAADERLAAEHDAPRGLHARRAAGCRRSARRALARAGPGRRASRTRRRRPRPRTSIVAGVLAHPGEVGLVVGGVRDRQEAVAGEAVGEEVVEQPAVLVAEHRVLRAADRHARRRRWRARAAGTPRRRARRTRTSPMCETSKTPARVRTASCSARMPSRVLDRHLPAGERHELRARGHVRVEERRALERRRRHTHEASGANGRLGRVARQAADYSALHGRLRQRPIRRPPPRRLVPRSRGLGQHALLGRHALDRRRLLGAVPPAGPQNARDDSRHLGARGAPLGAAEPLHRLSVRRPARRLPRQEGRPVRPPSRGRGAELQPLGDALRDRARHR